MAIILSILIKIGRIIPIRTVMVINDNLALSLVIVMESVPPGPGTDPSVQARTQQRLRSLVP